ncbi:MAG: HEPN domain-containing protein [Methanobrevibacter sp.]|nr:HEPN domain-containing protein [Candidatus Methanoflexus mossambicus]
MDNESKIFFEIAFETLEDSRFAIEHKRYNLSANRSYSTCFYAAKSLLLLKNNNPKTHSGTIQQFGLEYVVNGNFNNKIAEYFSELEDYRENYDYDAYYNANEEIAEDILEKTESFVLECEKQL